MSVNIYDKTNDRLNLISGGTLFADAPVGAIQAYGGATAPTGWLLCQGQAVSRTEYADLFKAIGTAFGEGDGSTTFNVPDLREAVPKGTGLNAKGSYHYDNDGIALGEFIDDRIKIHAHNVYVRDTGHAHSLALTLGAFPAGGQFLVPYNAAPSGVVTDSASANIQVNSSSVFDGEANTTSITGSFTNEVKAVGVNYIIKAKQVSVPFDVAEYIRNQNILADYEDATITNNSTNPTIMPYDGFLHVRYPAVSGGDGYIRGVAINGVASSISAKSAASDQYIYVPPVEFKKGDSVYLTSAQTPNRIKVRYYKLRDYTGR